MDNEKTFLFEEIKLQKLWCSLRNYTLCIMLSDFKIILLRMTISVRVLESVSVSESVHQTEIIAADKDTTTMMSQKRKSVSLRRGEREEKKSRRKKNSMNDQNEVNGQLKIRQFLITSFGCP